jgi:hypothetical protein
MSRWLLLALAGVCLATTPAEGGIKRSGTPLVIVAASHPLLASGPEDRVQERRPRLPESFRARFEGRPPVLPLQQREGVCAATSVCETY